MTNGFQEIRWQHLSVALLLIFLVRPLVGMLSFAACDMPKFEKFVISFFGIRGIGTIYYLAFAHNALNDFDMINDVWQVATCCIVISIVIHGISAKILMPKLEDK